MTTGTLIRWGGLVSIVTGLLLVLEEVVNLNGRSVPGLWLALVSFLLVGFALIALYAAQAERSGVLGLIGFVLTMLGAPADLIAIFAILTRVSGVDAAREVIKAFNTSPLSLLANFGFGGGLILFGIATMRAGVFPRWAGLLLIVGSLLAFVTDFAGLPPIGRLIAFALVGAGFAWMGWVLLAGTRQGAIQTRPAASVA